jgi:HEAT repeat protein/cyclophilin family peptidyl-prolyl cis-trans isomerase
MLLVLSVFAFLASAAGAQQRRPLSSPDIDDIATLLKLEDTRQFDEATLGRILKSAHPEVRRRAAVSIGRIAAPRGVKLLEGARTDRDPQVVADVVFAAGQLRQPESIAWLSAFLSAPATSPVIAREAARSLGKMVRNPAAVPAARTALMSYLGKATETAAAAPVIGEALLSVARLNGDGDLAPITRWATSKNVEIRWRAAWSLVRARRPAEPNPTPFPEAFPHLMRLSADPSPEVRYWAVRGLTPTATDAAAMKRPEMTSRLSRIFQGDADRRVKTEALRVLLQYDDETAFGALVNGLYSPDSWISVSAAEAAGRFGPRAAPLVPLLADVAEPQDSLSMKVTVLPVLMALAADATATLRLAGQLAQSDTTSGRNAGVNALVRLGARGRSAFEQISADPAMKGLLPTLEDFDKRVAALNTPPGGGRAGGGAGGGGRAGGAAGGGRGAPTPRQARPDAEYRQLVERFIVPDYNGAPKPRTIWETPRGVVEIELYAGDSPFGVEHLFRVVEAGDIVGTEFTRLVPDFVAQQQGIRNALQLRDEVNRHGLTRGNLSWASAGLDTGRPGYTLGHTPQPHNEGDFTALGRVVRGMDAVDKLELGDKILSAKLVRK